MTLRTFSVALILSASCATREPPPNEAVHVIAAAAATAPDASAIGSVASIDAGRAPACPSEMVLVQGNYCPTPRHVCKRWIDPPGAYQFYRCAEYEEPAKCGSPREEKRFCIDREEYVKDGETLPLAHQSWTMADAICKSRDRHMCLESEWQFACEGEEMRPYPYGFKRDKKACNIDRANLGSPNNGLTDLRASTKEYPGCMSPFGVHGMSGNVEEWAVLDKGQLPDRSVMKGAWWLPGKNTCRASTIGHGEIYEGPQVGVRCCKDIAN